MTCEQVREQLAEHLLGTLEGAVDAEVRLHLRGCASCRAEMRALAEGVGTFASAAHDVRPPDELRDRVLGVLEDEWSAPEPARAPRRRALLAWRIAAAAALVAVVAWGGLSTVRASRFEESATKYESLLGVLGGEDVRVGELQATDSQALQGSAVIYDSKVGQSWVLVLVRAPGLEGTANVTLVGDGKTIDMHELEFGAGGEASTWLVTAADLSGFDRVNIWNDQGMIATSAVERT